MKFLKDGSQGSLSSYTNYSPMEILFYLQFFTLIWVINFHFYKNLNNWWTWRFFPFFFFFSDTLRWRLGHLFALYIDYSRQDERRETTHIYDLKSIFLGRRHYKTYISLDEISLSWIMCEALGGADMMGAPKRLLLGITMTGPRL